MITDASTPMHAVVWGSEIRWHPFSKRPQLAIKREVALGRNSTKIYTTCHQEFIAATAVVLLLPVAVCAILPFGNIRMRTVEDYATRISASVWLLYRSI